jgi:hypothetical protein
MRVWSIDEQCSKQRLLPLAGIPDDVILKWVGHSSLKMSDHYTHRSGDSLAAMVEKIGGLSQVVPIQVIAVVPKKQEAA